MRWLGSWRDAKRIWAEEEARAKRPPQASPPAAGTAPAPGNCPPGSASADSPLRSPAPGLYGTRMMSSDFYDSGIVVTHDHLRNRDVVWLPPADDDDLAGLFSEEGTP